MSLKCVFTVDLSKPVKPVFFLSTCCRSVSKIKNKTSLSVCRRLEWPPQRESHRTVKKIYFIIRLLRPIISHETSFSFTQMCMHFAFTHSLSLNSFTLICLVCISLSLIFLFLTSSFQWENLSLGTFHNIFFSLSLSYLKKLTILCTTNTTIAKKGSTLHNWNFWGSVNCRWWPLFYNFDFSTEFSKIKLFMTWCELQTFDVGRGHLSKWRYHNDCLWTFYSHWPPLLNAVY